VRSEKNKRKGNTEFFCWISEEITKRRAMSIYFVLVKLATVKKVLMKVTKQLITAHY
jgi:hypothetical protein